MQFGPRLGRTRGDQLDSDPLALPASRGANGAGICGVGLGKRIVRANKGQCGLQSGILCNLFDHIEHQAAGILIEMHSTGQEIAEIGATLVSVRLFAGVAMGVLLRVGAVAQSMGSSVSLTDMFFDDLIAKRNAIGDRVVAGLQWRRLIGSWIRRWDEGIFQDAVSRK